MAKPTLLTSLIAAALTLLSSWSFAADGAVNPNYWPGVIVVTFENSVDYMLGSKRIVALGLHIINVSTDYKPVPKLNFVVEVPCGQEVVWARAFSNMQGVNTAYQDGVSYTAQYPLPPTFIPCPVFQENEANFHSKSHILRIPTVVRDGGRHFDMVLEGPYTYLSSEVLPDAQSPADASTNNATYDSVTDVLTIPMVVVDGKTRYKVSLKGPFHILEANPHD